MPLLFKQVEAVVDSRTTIVCINAAGQIRPVDSPYEVLTGAFMDPPFHVHCRSMSLPYMAGFVNEQRSKANAELQNRPLKDRDPRKLKSLPPPPLQAATKAGQRVLDQGGQPTAPSGRSPLDPPAVPPDLNDQSDDT